MIETMIYGLIVCVMSIVLVRWLDRTVFNKRKKIND